MSIVLSDSPNRRVLAAFLLHFPCPYHCLSLSQSQAIRANAFSSQIKGLTHVWQLHAPAMILPWWRAAIKPRSAFITDQLVHDLPCALLCSNRERIRKLLQVRIRTMRSRSEERLLILDTDEGVSRQDKLSDRHTVTTIS